MRIAAFPTEGPILPWIAKLPAERRAELLESIALEDLAEILDKEVFDFRLFARAEQLPPPGDWRVWGMQAGRGSGKSRAAGAWVAEVAEANPGCRIGLFAPTAAKAREVMVEDALKASVPPRLQPRDGSFYEPSKRRVNFSNGARAITYSADKPDQSRGANLHFAWADEVGEWADAEAWSNLDMALRKAIRSGVRPRVVVSTTPKPTELIREIFQGPKDESGRRELVSWSVLRPATGTIPASFIAWPQPDTVVTRWPTEANRANLAEDFMRRMKDRYAGSRLGRQELEAEILDDTPGALWNLTGIDEGRILLASMPRLVRVVVSVDPSHSDDGGGDACGIVVCGVTGERLNHGYVRADRSVNASPYEWGQAAIAAYNEFQADLIVYESNASPGKPDVVADVVRTVDPNGKIKWLPIHASRDKRTRADPVASLYETSRPGGARIHHVRDPKDPDQLALLEDEMTSWDPTKLKSPNRLDALVHGMSFLMLQGPAAPASPQATGRRVSPWKV